MDVKQIMPSVQYPLCMYENYVTGGDEDNYGARQAVWYAQTFTPSASHTITSVKLWLKKAGSPGTFTIHIQGVDVSDHPDGSDDCSGSIQGNDLTTSLVWTTISLGAGSVVTSGIMYAIVMEAKDAPTGNDRVKIWADSTSSGYDNGSYEFSADSGSSWADGSARDFLFEEWGV